MLDSFIAALTQRDHVSTHTVEAYRTDLAQLLQFLSGRDTDVAAVTPDDVLAFVAFLRARGYADSTVARRTAAMRVFFTHLKDTGVIAAHPMDGMASPKVVVPPPRVLSPAQVDALLERPLIQPTHERRRDKALLELLYSTGLRVTELLALNVHHVDLDAQQVDRGSGRTLPLNPAACTALEEYLDIARPALLRGQDEAALLVNHRGTRLTRQGAWLIMQHYADELGMTDLNPRVLRNSFAAHQLAASARSPRAQRAPQ